MHPTNFCWWIFETHIQLEYEKPRLAMNSFLIPKPDGWISNSEMIKKGRKTIQWNICCPKRSNPSNLKTEPSEESHQIEFHSFLGKYFPLQNLFCGCPLVILCFVVLLCLIVLSSCRITNDHGVKSKSRQLEPLCFPYFQYLYQQLTMNSFLIPKSDSWISNSEKSIKKGTL